MTQTQAETTYPPRRHVNARMANCESILPNGNRVKTYASAVSLLGVFDAALEAAEWRDRCPLTTGELAQTRAQLKAIDDNLFAQLLSVGKAQVLLVEGHDAPHTRDPLTLFGQFGLFR